MTLPRLTALTNRRDAVQPRRGQEKSGTQRYAEKAEIDNRLQSAIALAHGLTLATRHTADFEGVSALVVLNPWSVKD